GWSADGQVALVQLGHGVYRSVDGGEHFHRVDAAPSYAPAVSPDGTIGAYRRCPTPCRGESYQIALLDLARPAQAPGTDAGRPPRMVGRRHPVEFYIQPDGRSLVAAYRNDAANTACVDRIELPTGHATELACFGSQTGWEGIFAVSPDGRFGLLSTDLYWNP